jgi:hypothetical protein
MTAKRYELSEAQWARIAAFLPGKASGSGGLKLRHLRVNALAVRRYLRVAVNHQPASMLAISATTTASRGARWSCTVAHTKDS